MAPQQRFGVTKKATHISFASVMFFYLNLHKVYIRESDLELRADIFPCLSINGMLAKLTLYLEAKCASDANVRLNLIHYFKCHIFNRIQMSGVFSIRKTSKGELFSELCISTWVNCKLSNKFLTSHS
jgi:hypothetical protein